MDRMSALTEFELAAARRREVVREDRMDVRHARREVEQLDGRRNWLAAIVAAAVARTPLARG